MSDENKTPELNEENTAPAVEQTAQSGEEALNDELNNLKDIFQKEWQKTVEESEKETPVIQELEDAGEPEEEPEENAENLSEITEAELTEAYEGLLVAVSNMDTESANYIFNYLADYAIPESEKERFEKIKHAVSEFNWEEAANLLKA